MNFSDSISATQPDAQWPPLDKRLLGAAAAKLVAASIGDSAIVMSRSPAHKHFSLADIEWMILPPVLTGQFYVAEMAHEETGFHVPIALATFAFVSEDVDHRLQSDLSRAPRLRPDEWQSGEIGWIIDLAGDPRGISAALEWLKAGPFKARSAKLILRDGAGARVETLAGLMVASTPGEVAR